MGSKARENLSQSIAQLLPNIIQGVHLGFLAERTLTHSQFFVLIAIHSNHRCPMRVLAANMHVSMPTISGIVDRLVRAGYVRRLNDSQDRRQVVVELSGKGHEVIRQFQLAIGRRWKEVLLNLNSSEVESFDRIVTRLIKRLQGK